jgi:hypothetical protein
MTIFTHILATTAGVQAMGLRGREAVLAYLFGVAVDIDHLIKAPFYLKSVGIRNEKGYYWRSSLQEPVAFLWIVPLALFLGTPVPLIFFAIHLTMDYLVRYEKMPWYPYTKTVTRGWLIDVPDAAKEITLAIIFLCTNLFLYLNQR